jgi:hypothetical protein
MQHADHFPPFAKHSNVFRILTRMLHVPSIHTSLVCAIIRFIRTCIASKESAYIELILDPTPITPLTSTNSTSSIIVEPVVITPDSKISSSKPPLLAILFKFLANNGARYNLLSSSLLDFLSLINENAPQILIAAVEGWRQELDAIEYVSVGKDMIKKYEATTLAEKTKGESASPVKNGTHSLLLPTSPSLQNHSIITSDATSPSPSLSSTPSQQGYLSPTSTSESAVDPAATSPQSPSLRNLPTLNHTSTNHHTRSKILSSDSIEEIGNKRRRVST